MDEHPLKHGKGVSKILECQHCGKEVERTHNFVKISCFDCKQKRKERYMLVYNKKKRTAINDTITYEDD